MKLPARTIQSRRKKLLALCESLPEVKFELFGTDHTTIRVAKKTFAYHLNNHHGDRIVSLCCKSTRQRQQELLRLHPQRFYMPAYLGPSGWVALRLDRKSVDWGEVLGLLVFAYRLQAPRRLAAQLE